MFKWFSKSPSAVKLGKETDLEEGEVIDYPPPSRGLPCVGIDRLLSAQTEVIRDFRQGLPISDREFNDLILPAIRSVAGFVHLLPASENHHHAKAGGLLRHSLEVAHWAAQFSNPTTFEPFGDPIVRRKREPRWHVAAGLAGLLHDVGKPMTDLEVISRDGSRQWNKAIPLVDWLNEHSIERYVIAWHTGRQHAHENHAAGLARILLPERTIAWMLEGGSDIYDGLISALTRGTVESRLLALWKQADQTSVERDMKRSGVMKRDAGSGIALHVYLLEAIQQLIRDDRWRVNEPGSPVWLLHDDQGEMGLFIVWRKTTVQPIVDLLREQRVPGVGDDLQRLAQSLVDRGAAERYEDHLYWPISPSSLPRKQGKLTFLHAVRITDPTLIFNSKVPSPIQGIVGRDTNSAAVTAEGPASGTASTVQMSPEEGTPSSESRPVTPPVKLQPSGGGEPSRQTPIPQTEGASKRLVQHPPSAPVQKKTPEDQLRDAGYPGQALLRLVDAVNQGTVTTIFVQTKKGMLLQLGTEAAKHIDAGKLREELAKARFIQVDPLAPLSLTREVEGHTGILLINAIGRPLRSLLTANAVGSITHSADRQEPVDQVPSDTAGVQKAGRPADQDESARILGWLHDNPTVREVSAAIEGLSKALGLSPITSIRILKDHARIRISEGKFEVLERTDG